MDPEPKIPEEISFLVHGVGTLKVVCMGLTLSLFDADEVTLDATSDCKISAVNLESLGTGSTGVVTRVVTG